MGVCGLAGNHDWHPFLVSRHWNRYPLIAGVFDCPLDQEEKGKEKNHRPAHCLIFCQLSSALYMKHVAVLCLSSLLACGCEHNETITRLWSEQKLLKDSANNINERIGRYIQKGIYDSAEMQKIQLEAVHTRLKDIQSSIDNRSK